MKVHFLVAASLLTVGVCQRGESQTSSQIQETQVCVEMQVVSVANSTWGKIADFDWIASRRYGSSSECFAFLDREEHAKLLDILRKDKRTEIIAAPKVYGFDTGFVRAFRGFAHFRGGSARAWILAIVRNCCHTWRSGRQRDLDVMEAGWGEDAFDDPDAVAAADPETPETALIRSDEAGAVRAVLEALPAPFREVMVLREIEDLSYREIAEITGLPLGTVMSRLARARDAFRAAWHCRLPQGEATP